MMKKRKKKVIKFRQSLFWDVDPKTINPQKHKRYIIERILDFGDDHEAAWVYTYYSRKALRDAIDHSRVLQKGTHSLWDLLVEDR